MIMMQLFNYLFASVNKVYCNVTFDFHLVYLGKFRYDPVFANRRGEMHCGVSRLSGKLSAVNKRRQHIQIMCLLCTNTNFIMYTLLGYIQYTLFWTYCMIQANILSSFQSLCAITELDAKML